MRASLFQMFLLAVLMNQCQCYTYWVHSTCADRPLWDNWIKEAFDHAKRAALHLQDEADIDFEDVFSTLFGISKRDAREFERPKIRGNFNPRIDTVFNIALDTMRSVGNDWVRVKGEEGSQSHRDSLLRIYCDNDSRWKPETDTPWLIDEQNMMRTPAPTPWCRKNPTVWNPIWEVSPPAADNGITYYNMVEPPETAPQNPSRVVTTLCDMLFHPIAPHIQILPDSLYSTPIDKDLSEAESIEELAYGVPTTILHELVHAPPYQFIDDNEGSDPYGWRNIMEKTTVQRMRNADTYMYLGLWASLQDRTPTGGGGFTLPRNFEDKDDPMEHEDWQHNHDAILHGVVMVYPDVVKKRIPLPGLKLGVKVPRYFFA